MPIFKAWDVVAVPFPYTDKATRQRRPALVVSVGEYGLLWVLMITSAENRAWPHDVTVADLAQAGLPAPSVIRTAKIATIESKDAEKLGTADDTVREAVAAALAQRLPKP